MRILLFGKNGQVGWELNRSLQPLGDVVALGREDADFSKPDMLREIIRVIVPDVIVNAAAYTAVEKAEEEEELALLINAESPKALAEEALKINALLVHYSTDYVFDGTKDRPYTESDMPAPINAYGRTKLAGEAAIRDSGCNHLIFRTSWVYASRGNNFLLTILRLAQERDELSIISDQLGSPTSARLIAESTLICMRHVVTQKTQGDFTSAMYHLTASDKISWNGFAELAITKAKESPVFHIKTTSIKQVSTAEYNALANRPLNSCLSTDKMLDEFGIVLPSWETGLQLCMDELYPVER